jgi:tRNA-2-methylthio-N6-dimethylallyladenosine synthase
MQAIKNIGLKDHDESRQGEVLMLDTRPGVVDARKFYIESYGCAMNFSDSEIVASIMSDMGFVTTDEFREADVVFINTCSIRENAEQRVRNRLKEFGAVKKANPGMIVGVLGCMAERLKAKFLEEEKLVDVVIGPDAYRDLPGLIGRVDEGDRAVNVLLSREETYADISPVRLNTNGISAFVSIMRGCDNMCSFCVVPFTRGRERSRDAHSIYKEVQELFEQGYREVTLLGQNVDSYKWQNEEGTEQVNFAGLLEMVSAVSPLMRIRFSTSHPKDITDEVLHTMSKHANICKYIHLPVQSGNSRILEMMNRTYDREWYIDRISAIRRIMPECAISTDMITGFCSETEEEHRDTLSLMEYVKFDFAYMFIYSERPGTPAAKKYADDVPQDIKGERLKQIVALQHVHQLERLQQCIGKTYQVLIEGTSKKSQDDFSGRSDQNAVVIFPKMDQYKPGDYVNVKIERCTSATLMGSIVC